MVTEKGGFSLSIKNITADDLRRMEDKEGLILQGCGGDPKEWVDGINQMFTEEGILLEGTEFTEVSVFEHDGLACILYPFEDVKIGMGKLAVWRLQTHEDFGGIWLSDYVPNRLGGFKTESLEKPDCALIGENGNIFNLAGIAAGTLREHGMKEQAEEMKSRVCSSHSYEEALCIIGEYVNVTSGDGQELVDMEREQETRREETEKKERGR